MEGWLSSAGHPTPRGFKVLERKTSPTVSNNTKKAKKRKRGKTGWLDRTRPTWAEQGWLCIIDLEKRQARRPALYNPAMSGIIPPKKHEEPKESFGKPPTD